MAARSVLRDFAARDGVIVLREFPREQGLNGDAGIPPIPVRATDTYLFT